MSIGSDLADDLPDLGLETHIQHTISFVHDQVRHTTQVSLAGLKHVDKAAGSGDHDLNASGEVSNLWAFGSTTVDSGITDFGCAAELGAFFMNLDGQFTGGGEDKNDGTVTGSEKWLPGVIRVSATLDATCHTPRRTH